MRCVCDTALIFEALSRKIVMTKKELVSKIADLTITEKQVMEQIFLKQKAFKEVKKIPGMEAQTIHSVLKSALKKLKINIFDQKC